MTHLRSLLGWCCVAVATLSGCTASRPDEPSLTLRVMTYNIHHGEGTDGSIDIRRIADVILASRADVIALQEVDRNVERSGNRDIIIELADLTGLTYAFGKNLDYQGGDYGNAVLTKFPILEERNLHYSMIREGEQRGLLQLVIEVEGVEVVIMNTHLDYRQDDTERQAHAAELKQAAARYGTRPVIVCGDLNDTPASNTLSSLKPEFIDIWEHAGSGPGFSYPSTNPAKRIDYILFSAGKPGGPALRPRSAGVVQSTSSDHLPVIAEFEITVP